MERSVYFEIRTIGHMLKVSAIDEITGVEVVVSGAPAMVESLKRTALKKLEYVLRKGNYHD